MAQSGARVLGRAEQTIIRLVCRPDRRQLRTRRSTFRGGRRIDDAIEGLARSTGRKPATEKSSEAQGSAIVMGWAALPTGHRDTVKI